MINYNKKKFDNENFKTDIHTENITSILNQESKNNKSEPWTKINKTSKIRLINEYCLNLSSKFSLTNEEISQLQKYLLTGIENKRLTSVKDVIYDKDNKKITNIPSLFFNEKLRKFTLKRSERRSSTLKSLSKGKIRKKETNIKEI
tara:strand:+ start:10300 stop:10737 length:438 start_codon:yes stop_codon:yes gene_type:complete